MNIRVWATTTATLPIIAMLALAGCGGGGGGTPSVMEMPQDHVVQLPRQDASPVAGLRNEDGDLTGLRVGNTAVSLDFHRSEA